MNKNVLKLTIEERKQCYPLFIQKRNNLINNPILYSIVIGVTKKCNEKCLHCGVSCTNQISEQELSNDEIITALKQLKKDLIADNQPKPHISISGGEPLIRPDLTELIEQIRALGYTCDLNTNGYLLTQDKLRELKNIGLDSIGISLDGLEETHNWFRQINSFSKTIQAIKDCVALKIPITVAVTVHKRNISELYEIYNLIQKIGCNHLRFMFADPCGRALQNPEILLSNDDYKIVLDTMTTILSNKENTLPLFFGCNHYLGLTYEGIVRKHFFMCNTGITSMSIQSNGDITGCLLIERRPELTFGNIRTDSLYDVWKNGFQIFRQDKSLTSIKCMDCKERERCGGSGWHTFDFDSWKPKICMYEELHKPNPSGNFSSLVKKAKKFPTRE